MSKKNNRSLYLIILGSILAFIAVVNAVDNRRYAVLKEYQLVLLEDSCNIKIRKVSFDRGWVKVISTDTDSLLLVDSHNYSNEDRYGESSFGLFIKPGDIVLKRVDSDTFFVRREDKEYFFIVDYTESLDPNVVN